MTHIETPPPGDAELRTQRRPDVDDERVVKLKFRYILGAVILVLVLGGIATYFALGPKEQTEKKYFAIYTTRLLRSLSPTRRTR